MKRILLLICLFSAWCAYAENTMQLSSTQGHPSDTVTLTLSMTNSDEVVALQAMIPLHGQLTFVPGSCVLTDRSNGHYVTATVLHDTLRIYSYSLSLTPYSGNSGDLLSFKVVLKNEPATYTLPLCNAMLSSATGSSLNVSVTAGAATILAPKIALSTGSINYGHIPIRSTYTQNLTVQNTGNEPLNLSSISFNDSTLSATDVAQTIAVGGQSTVSIQYAPVMAGAITRQAVIHSNAHVGDSTVTILADPFSVNELRPLPVSGETDSIVTVSLRMNNMDSIVGLQSGIILPSALTYVPGSFQVSAERSNGHLASAGMSGDTLVMIITHLQNLPLHGGDGVVATFQLQLHGYGYYSLNLIQTALSDASGHNVLSAVYSNGVQIYSPSINCASTLDMGYTPVTEPLQQSISVNNNGNATLVIHQVVFTNSDFSLVTPLPVTISAWQSSELEVEYNGTQEGTHSGLMAIYSNDPFNPMKQVTLTASRYEPNYLKISADANAVVDDAAVFIDLDNYSMVTALQMDVEYPWLHYSTAPSDIHLTERCGNHLITASSLNDSTIRVLILSMQNQPISGNNGTVAKINLHPTDTTDEQSYPFRLHNVLTGGLDGLDRLTSYDSVVYIATRTVHDTTYFPVHDTTYVDVHDTTYIDIHDTTYIDVFIPIHDTTYIDVFVPVHDTIYIDVPYLVHDTTYINIHDTTYVDVYVPVYDTTYVTLYDTVVLTLHDTTYVDVPYPVHDTTYVTITLTDTVYVWQYDTTYITVHDTITIIEPLIWYTLQVLSEDVNKGVAAGSGQFPEGTDVEIAAVPIEGNRFLQWSDGSQENPRSVIVNSDMLLTAQFTTTGVENHIQPTWYAYSDGYQIIVKGVEGQTIHIYDEIGKLIYISAMAPSVVQYPISAIGTYFVQVGTGPDRKVTVMR